YLDGARVGQDQYRSSGAPTERKATLEARAPGYVSERREVALDEDVTLKLVLQPDPVETSEIANTAASADHKASGDTKMEPDLPKSAGASAHVTPRPVKPRDKSRTTTPSPSCNPPYTLGSDGVKTYKPECF
ncbi:MAG TPA: hypothetical protein VGL13_16450, partial [Polyangiaceae bacterium]